MTLEKAANHVKNGEIINIEVFSSHDPDCLIDNKKDATVDDILYYDRYYSNDYVYFILN